MFDGSAQSPPAQSPHSKKDNSAVIHFTGQDTQINDQRKYEAWYTIDTLIYLANINLPPTSIAYIFHSESVETKYISFENQLRHLVTYKNKQPTSVMACFIAFEAAQFATSHFTFGLLVDNILLFINPLGNNKPTFYQYLAKIQTTVLNGYTIYISNTVIQKDEHSIVSCGPLCVELLKHFASLTANHFKEALSLCPASSPTAQGLKFIQIDVLNILPTHLQNLVAISPGNPTFKAKLEQLRSLHLSMLTALNDAQCEILKEANVQISIFEAMRKEEEARTKVLKLAAAESEAPELKMMNKALEYLVFSLEQVVQDIQTKMFNNITMRWQMISKTFIFLQNQCPHYFSFVENSCFLSDDKIRINVTLKSIQNYSVLFRQLYNYFQQFSPQKPENTNQAQLSLVIEALRAETPAQANFRHQDWASTNLAKLEAILLPREPELIPASSQTHAPMPKPIAKRPPIAPPTLLRSFDLVSETTTDSLRGEIHTFLETESEGGLDPFYWQIEQLYRGSLRTLDHLTATELNKIIHHLIDSIKQLDAEGFFKELEQDVRACVHRTLRNHLEDLVSYEDFEKENQAIENARIERASEIAIRRAEYEDDPDGWEYDYDGMRYPSDLAYSDDSISDRDSASDSDDASSSWHDDESISSDYYQDDQNAYLAWRVERSQEFGDLDDLQNVISVCTGPEGLDWLAHQYAEYDVEIGESLIKEIRLKNMSFEPEVVDLIIHTMFLERGYDASNLHKDGFAAQAFIESLSSIEEGDSSLKENPFVTTKAHLTDKINSRFARLKDLIQQGKLQTLRHAYNNAHAANNHFEMQKHWYVFTKVQRLLRSSEGSRCTTPLPPVGNDYSFRMQPLTYEQLLQMAYEAYERRSISLHYRIFPTEQTRYLSYHYRRNPYRIATLDVMEIFEELARVGMETENILRRFNKDFTNNIIVPTFYFIVSDKPHRKGGEHSRKFIVVDLALPNMDFLLSNDRDDRIFPPYEEKHFLEYRAEKANKDYEDGCKIINLEKKQTRQPPCSEKGLFELLQRRPEIVNSLLQAIARSLSITDATQGKYKIYGGGIISYSTNSTCDFCTLSYIALQNSYQTGFLSHFINQANGENSGLKTRGFDKGQPQRFLFHTIVQFRECYTVQSLDLHDLASPRIEKMREAEIPIYRNPDAKLHFKDNTVEIHKSNSETAVPNVALIEFIKTPNQQNSTQATYRNHRQQRFTFYGHAFMSGSKKRDFPNQAKEINLAANQMINAHREKPRQ